MLLDLIPEWTFDRKRIWTYFR